MIASVEDDFLFYPLTSRDAPRGLHTYQGERLTCTTRFPSRNDMYFVHINYCTLALKVLRSSVECHIKLAWYPHCTSGSYHSGYGYDNGFRGLESTNKLWIRGCRSWLYDIIIGSRWASLLSRLLWGLCWLWCWLWYPRPWARWVEWGAIQGCWYDSLGIDGCL